MSTLRIGGTVLYKVDIIRMSMDVIERLNREICRRTGVVWGIFPGADAYTRLVTTYLMEYAEDWDFSKASYLSEQSVLALLSQAA